MARVCHKAVTAGTDCKSCTIWLAKFDSLARHLQLNASRCGGIGIHRAFKSLRRKSCRFESCRRYQNENITRSLLIQRAMLYSIRIVNSVGRVPLLQGGSRKFKPCTIHASITQLVECRSCKANVAGSTPVRGSTI